MKTVMVSGNFDPFHYGHLDYIKKASELGEVMCIISSDSQVVEKKGSVNEPAAERAMILHYVLRGIDIRHWVRINIWDKTTMVAEALRAIKPDIFCRGSDKAIDDMPLEEKMACDELGIEIVHVEGRIVHGSEFV